jgi:hypothetical protein
MIDEIPQIQCYARSEAGHEPVLTLSSSADHQ